MVSALLKTKRERTIAAKKIIIGQSRAFGEYVMHGSAFLLK